jgi:hypothetical protein
MPKGLKETSSIIAVGFSVSESAPNTFTQGQVDLQLNPLDNEVFVVYAIDLDLETPDALAGTNTAMQGALTTTSRTALPNLSDSTCLAVKQTRIRAAGFVDGGVGFTTGSNESPATQLEYLGIIATNDFFIQVEGANNAVAHSMSGKLYGVRARADSAIYAALVQSEVLSAWRWTNWFAFTATGAVLIGLQVKMSMRWRTSNVVDSLMSPVSTNWTAHVESMTVIVLILVVVARKVIRLLSNRHFPSHLTLQTDSFDLHLQTKPPSSPQELQRQEQQGVDEDGRSTDDDGRIPAVIERTHFWHGFKFTCRYARTKTKATIISVSTTIQSELQENRTTIQVEEWQVEEERLQERC